MARPARRRAPGGRVLRNREWILLALGAVLSASTILREIGPHDEGLMLQAASRIADGQLPYRDFWWNYAPGQPLLLGALHSITGPSLVVWRIVRVAVDAITAVLAYRLARRTLESDAVPGTSTLRGQTRSHFGARHLNTAVPLLVWLAVAGAMAWPATPNPNPAALMLGLLALVAGPRRPVLGGAVAGLAAVFRLEVGIAAAVGVVVAVGRRPAPPVGDPGRIGRRTAAALAALGVAVAGWLPFFVAAPGELLDQTVGFLGKQDLQRLPFPLEPSSADPNKLLELWFPLILLAGAALWAVGARGRAVWGALMVVGVAYLLARTDEFHLLPLAALVPIAVLTARPRAAAIAVIALVAMHGIDRKAGLLLHPPPLAPVPGPAADGVRAEASDAAALRVLLRAIRANTREREPIFVAPPRFDQVTVGNPLLYVLADRPNPTRYDVMQPGVVTTAAVQREIVHDLERTRPRFVVRWRDPRTAPEDNGSGRSSGVRFVDTYIATAYRPAIDVGVYELLVRR